MFGQTCEKKSSNMMSVGRWRKFQETMPPITPVLRGIEKVSWAGAGNGTLKSMQIV